MFRAGPGNSGVLDQGGRRRTFTFDDVRNALQGGNVIESLKALMGTLWPNWFAEGVELGGRVVPRQAAFYIRDALTKAHQSVGTTTPQETTTSRLQPSWRGSRSAAAHSPRVVRCWR